MDWIDKEYLKSFLMLVFSIFGIFLSSLIMVSFVVWDIDAEAIRFIIFSSVVMYFLWRKMKRLAE